MTWGRSSLLILASLLLQPPLLLPQLLLQPLPQLRHLNQSQRRKMMTWDSVSSTRLYINLDVIWENMLIWDCYDLPMYSHLDIRGVLHGVPSELFYKDDHFFVLINLHVRIFRLGWVLLSLLGQVETHLFLHLPLHWSHRGQHRHRHLYLLPLLVYTRNVPEELHEHLILGFLFPRLLVSHHLHHFNQAHFFRIFSFIIIIINIIGGLCTSPLNAGVPSLFITIKFLKGFIRNLLIVTIDLPRTIISTQTLQQSFQSSQLWSRGDHSNQSQYQDYYCSSHVRNYCHLPR